MIRKPLFAAFVVSVVSTASAVLAWGPHVTITQAALNVLPDSERWKTALGTDNLAALENEHCRLPDRRGQNLGAFDADDYLLFRGMPNHLGHCMPTVQGTFEPYFRRALQALRTETPVNACRQVGAFIHFVEDAGAPPHAKEQCPHHKELENWVRAEAIVITGYQPQLLGATDDEALAGLQKRIAGLVAFSRERAERALPLVTAEKPDRSRVEPILLESALEALRVTADALFTVFTLGLEPQAEGAGLIGTVAAPRLAANDQHGARIILMDTDYTTVATTVIPQPEGAAWQGIYEFSHLPPGTYRALACRPGSQFLISAPVTLEAGKKTRLDLALSPTTPVGNLIQNPDAQVAYIQPPIPDKWQQVAKDDVRLWTSTAVGVKPNTTYHCGAAVKDPATEVCFRFRAATPADNAKKTPDLVCPLTSETTSISAADCRAETTVLLDAHRWKDVVVEVRTSKPLTEAIREVWVAP